MNLEKEAFFKRKKREKNRKEKKKKSEDKFDFPHSHKNSLVRKKKNVCNRCLWWQRINKG